LGLIQAARTSSLPLAIWLLRRFFATIPEGLGRAMPFFLVLQRSSIRVLTEGAVKG
jgi:hypothetical protein